MPGVWKFDTARIMAVCDLDQHRVDDAKALVNGYYGKQAGKPYDGVTGYSDYRELLANKDVDAVLISTPDHWHALIAHRRGAGRQGRLPAEAGVAHDRGGPGAERRGPPHSGRIFQIGSQQRSTPQFRYAAELVRNGRIGQLKTVQIGLPGRSLRRRRAGDARAQELQLREVAGLDARRLLHREARPPAGRLRPPRLAALRAVRRGNDHRLGRPPRRQRALGDGHRVHRAGRDLGLRRSSRATGCGTCTATSRPRASTRTACA